MIDAKMLSRMRTEIANLLPSTCILMTETITFDSSGSAISSLSASGTVACRADLLAEPSRSTYASLTAGLTNVSDMKLFTLGYAATLGEATIIRYNGNDYRILTIEKDRSWEASLRVVGARL
jgi:hypothetical protein